MVVIGSSSSTDDGSLTTLMMSLLKAKIFPRGQREAKETHTAAWCLLWGLEAGWEGEGITRFGQRSVGAPAAQITWEEVNARARLDQPLPTPTPTEETRVLRPCLPHRFILCAHPCVHTKGAVHKKSCLQPCMFEDVLKFGAPKDNKSATRGESELYDLHSVVSPSIIYAHSR